MALTVGFDLDMTLVDSRAGIMATLEHTLAAYGLGPGEAELWPHIGHPLEVTLGRYLPPEHLEAAVAAYRLEYLRSAVAVTTTLPGALESVAAVREEGGRVVVVSAKTSAAVHAVLAQVGLQPDDVVGDLFGSDKGLALSEHHVDVYVGDHVGDVEGALAAGAVPVAVLTGPNDRASLEAAGAEVVLESLLELPGWLQRTRRTRLP